MFEGSYNSQSDEAIEEPFDYVAEAQRLREEREAKAAKEKAEKDVKEKKKREDRIAKKLADAAAKKEEVVQKGDSLQDSTAHAKEQVEQAKHDAEAIKKDVQVLAEKDVEMNATNGSEYIAELKEGEGAVLLFEHATEQLDTSIKQTEEATDLADEVSERAAALSRARDAVLAVEQADMGIHNATDESAPVYDLGMQQNELQERIQHAWEAPQSHEEPETVIDANSVTSDSTYESSYSYDSGSIERAPDPTSPVTTSLKNGFAHVSGLLAGRARVNRITKSLDTTRTSLRAETSAIKRDVDTIQRQSMQHEFSVPRPQPIEAVKVPSPETMNYAKRPEVSGTDAPAIPEWIRQVERDLKNSKVAELKKWQVDILRIQHPALLKRYEQLDHTVKESLKNNTREVLRNQFAKPTPVSTPGSLPTPVSLPSYMTPGTPVAKPVYEYATVANGVATGTLSGNGYLAIIVVGGIIFGAALITAFGL